MACQPFTSRIPAFNDGTLDYDRGIGKTYE
jgi:hypothetical protein